MNEQTAQPMTTPTEDAERLQNGLRVIALCSTDELAVKTACSALNESLEQAQSALVQGRMFSSVNGLYCTIQK